MGAKLGFLDGRYTQMRLIIGCLYKDNGLGSTILFFFFNGKGSIHISKRALKPGLGRCGIYKGMRSWHGRHSSRAWGGPLVGGVIEVVSQSLVVCTAGCSRQASPPWVPLHHNEGKPVSTQRHCCFAVGRRPEKDSIELGPQLRLGRPGRSEPCDVVFLL